MIDFRDMSSMNLTGYIEFLLMVAVNKSAYREIVEKMYREMQEYLINIPLNISGCRNSRSLKSDLFWKTHTHGLNKKNKYAHL